MWGSIEGFEGGELHGQICVGPARGMLHTKKGDVGIRKTMRWVLSYRSMGQKEEARMYERKLQMGIRESRPKSGQRPYTRIRTKFGRRPGGAPID